MNIPRDANDKSAASSLVRNLLSSGDLLKVSQIALRQSYLTFSFTTALVFDTGADCSLSAASDILDGRIES